MVIATLKEIEEIKEMLKDYKKVLTVGCAGCTSVCLAGGQKEVETLNPKLKSSFKDENLSVEFDGYTVERQCEMEFIDELEPMVDKYDAILSMGCGAGVQFVAERFPEKPTFPSLNSTFVGVNKDIGWFEEKCRLCRDCMLAYTGGICPVTKCAKSIFNGPCGGTQEGMCEVDKGTPCAWNDIYERLKKQDRLDSMLNFQETKKWQNQMQGNVILDEFKDRYTK